MKKICSIQLDKTDVEILDKIAQSEERTRSYLVRSAVRVYLDGKTKKTITTK